MSLSDPPQSIFYHSELSEVPNSTNKKLVIFFVSAEFLTSSSSCPMSGSSHIGVEYQNFGRLFTFCYSAWAN